MTATNNLISRLDSFSQPKIFVLTLDESEASIMVVACETIRHRLESIARANKMDSSISSEERQTIKHACHVVANLTVKLRGFRKAGKLGSLVRNLDMKWRTARRALSPLPAKHRESDMSDDLKPCPGCASRNLFDGPTAIGNPERYVRCYQCGMSGAFTAWNRRASDSEIERLRAALQNLTTKMGAQKAVTGREFSITVEVALRSARAALSPLTAKENKP